MNADFWRQLAALDAGSVCRRSGAVREQNGYRLKVLDAEYGVSPQDRAVVRFSGAPEDPEVASEALEQVIVRYLLNAKDIPLSGEWIAMQDLGRFFISHGPDLDPLLDLFTHSPEAIRQAMQTLGGQILTYGDFSAALPVLPRLPIAWVFWESDEEFPARVSVLFDRTATQHLSLDVLSATVREATRRLRAVACQKKAR